MGEGARVHVLCMMSPCQIACARMCGLGKRLGPGSAKRERSGIRKPCWRRQLLLLLLRCVHLSGLRLMASHQCHCATTATGALGAEAAGPFT